MAPEVQDPILHYSYCVQRNDVCTADPQTIIYSSPHRPAVHDAKVKAILRDYPSQPPPPIPTNHRPPKRSLAPVTEVDEFVARFSTYAKCSAVLQATNPLPSRPTSSSSQTNDDDRTTRSTYNVTLHAPPPLIRRGRGDILQHLQLHHQTFISAPQNLLLNEHNQLFPAYADELDRIAVECVVEIILARPSNLNFTLFSNRKKHPLRRGYLNTTDELKDDSDSVIIMMNGSLPSLESGRIRLHVLLDRMRGSVCEVLDGIDHKTHPLLAGRRRYELEENIEKAFQVKIYMHAPTVKIFKDNTGIDRHYNRIYVTGSKENVTLAVAALQKRAATFMTMSKEVILHCNKIDWIITEKLEKMREIMDEDATFILLPPLGAEQTVISVSGTTLPLIERSIRRMNKLISDYFQFTYVILPDQSQSLDPPCELAALAWRTGAEVNYSGNCFEINGNEHAFRGLFNLLLNDEMNFYSQYPYRVRIRCEMANELQEFVAGKKSGKVNKIMKNTNCNIAFEPYTEYNFLIDIMAPHLRELSEGYKQLLEEFPAELYWYVPEEYHKRIIGVQGKTIQRIMKHYSVYVKFFNALEFAAAGGDSKTEDNVLARTPAKNSPALEECRKAVLEMVFQNDRDYITETVEIPKVHHAHLQRTCQQTLQEIGKNSGATIRFPEPNTSLEAVAITAAPTRIKDVARQLLDLVPVTFDIVGDDPKLNAIVENSDFHYAITDQFKMKHIDLLIIKDNSEATKSSSNRSITFQFQYVRPYYKNLQESVHDLGTYIRSKGGNLETVTPPPPADPETKPFDQDKSSSYGQGSVTQPYHSPAQIAAAAQGNLHPSYHMGNQHTSFPHQSTSNGAFHQNHGNAQHQNGYNNHSQHPGHFGRGYQQLPNSFGPNRGGLNGNRYQHNPAQHAPQYASSGYPPFQPQHPANRGGGINHSNHPGPYNGQYNQGGGMNNSMAETNGFSRRYMNTPPTPNGDHHQSPGPSSNSYQTVRGNSTMVQSPLDTLSSMELPEYNPPNPPTNGGYRQHQEGHTPVANGGHFSPPSQSYFPPQPNHPQSNHPQSNHPHANHPHFNHPQPNHPQHHNGYPHGPGYPGGPLGPPGSRHQG